MTPSLKRNYKTPPADSAKAQELLYLFCLGDKSKFLLREILRRSLFVLSLVFINLNLICRREVVAVSCTTVWHAHCLQLQISSDHAFFSRLHARRQLLIRYFDNTGPLSGVFNPQNVHILRESETYRAQIYVGRCFCVGFLNAQPMAAGRAFYRHCANQPGCCAAARCARNCPHIYLSIRIPLNKHPLRFGY